MQIIIDIPEIKYRQIIESRKMGFLLSVLENIIANGTPLPKEHGRLIDADKFKDDNYELWNCDFIHPKYCDTLAELVTDAPTVLGADRED